MSADSAWAFAGRFCSFVVHCAILLVYSSLIAKHVRAGRAHVLISSHVNRGLVWGCGCALFLALENLAGCLDMLFGNITARALETFQLAALLLGSILCVLCCLNVSAMWIEFFLTTERLQAYSKHLNYSRLAVLGVMVIYSLVSLVLLFFSITVSLWAYYIYVGWNAIASIVIAAFFQWGAHRLAATFMKAAHNATVRAEDETHHGLRASQVDMTRPSQAACVEEAAATARVRSVNAKNEGESFVRRAQLIVRTARRVTVGSGLFLYGCLGYLIFNQYRSRAALAGVWGHVIVMHGAVGWTLLCIHDYILGATIKARAHVTRRDGPPRHKVVPMSSSSPSSRTSPAPRVSEEPIVDEG